jgi:hypothetical protein
MRVIWIDCLVDIMKGFNLRGRNLNTYINELVRTIMVDMGYAQAGLHMYIGLTSKHHILGN